MNTNHPKYFIEALRKATGRKMWTHGNCYQLYLILKTQYPEAIAYYNGDHIYTEINGTMYDINGQHDKNDLNVYKLSDEPRIEEQAPRWKYDSDEAHALIEWQINKQAELEDRVEELKSLLKIERDHRRSSESWSGVNFCF